MIVQRIWAVIIGLASMTVGILKFFSVLDIPTLDALIHITSGVVFICGAAAENGRYARQTNLWLGLFYIFFGAVGFNWPHVIAGAVTLFLGLSVPIAKPLE